MATCHSRAEVSAQTTRFEWLSLQISRQLQVCHNKHDIPFNARGHDASISRGSIKAFATGVWDRRTSAVAHGPKSHCGFRIKSCPSRWANLKCMTKSRGLQWKKKPTSLYVRVLSRRSGHLVTGTAEGKLYTRLHLDRWERRSAHTLGRWEGRQQRNRMSAHVASLRLSKKHSTPLWINSSATNKWQGKTSTSCVHVSKQVN